MFNRIIYIIKNFHKLPLKIYNKLKFNYFKSFFDKDIFINQQIENFSNVNLNWEEGKKKLDEIKKNFNIQSREMSSEHEIVFSSISLNKNYEIKEILEIGTFDGINALLLSKLFSFLKFTNMSTFFDNLFSSLLFLNPKN